jgi:hypothetical protein
LLFCPRSGWVGSHGLCRIHSALRKSPDSSGITPVEISPAGREFFEVHCECDEAHAGSLREVIEKLAQIHGAAAIEQIWQGIRIAEQARQGFYDALTTELELVT